MAYCEVWDMGDGTVAHVRLSGRPPALCEVCRNNRHTKLCDFPTGRKRTCDKKLCGQCAHHSAPDLDYCPEHKDGPATLFSGPQGFFDVK